MGTFHDEAQSAAARKHGERFYWLFVFKNHPGIVLLAALAAPAVAIAVLVPGALPAAARFIDTWGTAVLVVLAAIVLAAVVLLLRPRARRSRRFGRRY